MHEFQATSVSASLGIGIWVRSALRAVPPLEQPGWRMHGRISEADTQAVIGPQRTPMTRAMAKRFSATALVATATVVVGLPDKAAAFDTTIEASTRAFRPLVQDGVLDAVTFRVAAAPPPAGFHVDLFYSMIMNGTATETYASHSASTPQMSFQFVWDGRDAFQEPGDMATGEQLTAGDYLVTAWTQWRSDTNPTATSQSDVTTTTVSILEPGADLRYRVRHRSLRAINKGDLSGRARCVYKLRGSSRERRWEPGVPPWSTRRRTFDRRIARARCR
jgi:hypothetical protein